jgi:effector-binding domain-containing protein
MVTRKPERLLRLLFAAALAGATAAAPFGVSAQQAAPAPATPAPAAPAPAMPAMPAPAVPAPAPAPAPAAPAAPATPAPATPAPQTGETATPPGVDSGGEMREVAEKPVLRLKGQTTWDDGFNALKKAIAALEAEASRLNLTRAGNAMTYFVDSDDLGFTFEAMLPIAAPPAAGAVFTKDFDATVSPSGRAVIFSHEGAYDEIDTAYEALTAWLDDKNLVSTGKFLEEYESIPEKADDTTMKLKIIVFLK